MEGTFMSRTASETLILVLLASLLSWSTYNWACCTTFICTHSDSVLNTARVAASYLHWDVSTDQEARCSHSELVDVVHGGHFRFEIETEKRERESER